MRLGDLDALKEDFKSRLADCNEWIEKAKDKETKIRASAIKAFIGEVIMTIDNAPTVELTEEQAIDKLHETGWLIRHDKEMTERPQGEWVPIKYRPMTSEERKKFAEHYGIEYCDTLEEKAFDCPMPEDGQKILISTSWGVDIDVADNDIDGEGFICYGLEGNGDWDSVIAWQPLPKPYQRGGAE